VTNQGLDSFIEEIANELRRPVRLDPRFDDRVMEAIEAPEVIPLRPASTRPWILRPRTISISPLGALAAAAAIAGIIALGVWREGAPTPETAAVPADAPFANVANATTGFHTHQFLFLAPDAKKMVVVGDFNDWDETRTPMTRDPISGLWTVTVPLSIGLHQFQYVKDDTLRLNDPTLPQQSNDFGSPNSIITISTRGG